MSVTRSPRCRLSINGQTIFPMEANVHQSIHQSADTFYAKLPLLPDLGLDETFWAETAPIPISIDGINDVSSGSGSYTNLLTGVIDVPQIIFHERAVSIKGRDKTATLTETKTTELWPNQTDQQIITQLAGNAGLTVQFNASPDKAGLDLDANYYQELSDQDSAWNMIVALAKKAGCIAFIKGTTLYVQPVDATAPNGMFTVSYRRPQPGQVAQSNAVMLTCARNLMLAKETSVQLQSYQHQQGQAVTSKFSSKPKKAGSDRLIYTHRAANLTKQQQDKIALSHLKETLSHEREVNVDGYPGDVAVAAGLNGLTLKNTGTAYDQDYILSDVVHRFALDGGYTMDLSAHNQDASRGQPTQDS